MAFVRGAPLVASTLAAVGTARPYAKMLGDGAAEPAEAAPIGVFIWLGCMTPAILGSVSAALVRMAAAVDLPTSAVARGLPYDPSEGAHLRESEHWSLARRTVSSEWARMQVVFRNADFHARIWGLLGSMALAGCTLLVPALHTPGGTGQHAADTPDHIVSAVAATVAICSLLSFAQVLVRSAAHDASTALFSNASRDLLVSIVVTVVAASVLPFSENSHAGAVGLGFCVGLLGPRALAPLRQRAAGALGIKLPADGNALSLGMIEGLSDAVMERMAEDGLDSVHALAFTNTPRIYLATPYTWDRISDWQAQAMLLEQLGLARFAKFKEQFPIRGVQDALRMIESDATLRQVSKALGPEVAPVLKTLRSSEALKMFALYGKYGDALLCEVSSLLTDEDDVGPADADLPEAASLHPRDREVQRSQFQSLRGVSNRVSVPRAPHLPKVEPLDIGESEYPDARRK